MKSPIETLRSFRGKINKSEQGKLLEQHASATTVFDKSVSARDPQFLNNHLNTAKTVVKLFESLER